MIAHAGLGTFVAFIGTDVVRYCRDQPEFTDSTEDLYTGEIGMLYGVRIFSRWDMRAESFLRMLQKAIVKGPPMPPRRAPAKHAAHPAGARWRHANALRRVTTSDTPKKRRESKRRAFVQKLRKGLS